MQVIHKQKPAVLIITEETEMSTDSVIEWITYLGGRAVRINGRQFFEESTFEFSLQLASPAAFNYSITINGACFSKDEIRSVWFRRDEPIVLPAYLDRIADTVFRETLKRNMSNELNDVKQSILYALSQKFRIGSVLNKSPNKFEVLHQAQQVGMDVPATLYTNKKTNLITFKDTYGRIINKAVGNIFNIKDKDDTQWGAFTNEVLTSDIDNTEDTFGASCFQELLVKEFEVRTFYLFGKTYSMAIFSQNDSKTEIDFRHYNEDRPNRNVPYVLPDALVKKLTALMNALQLNTGSIDFVKTTNDRLVFLEINPVGQYGMTSHPCNYSLDKLIAEYLLTETI